MAFKKCGVFAVALWVVALSNEIAVAAVSAEEAAKLKSTLTPLGAEKAGNKDGSIPAWTGGYTTVPTGYKPGHVRPDPFATEKPLFRVAAANADQYGDKVTEGVKALLKRFPSYRMDVYPTHRTATAPQWVYDNIFKNATRAKIKNGGNSVEGAYGGIPFPIPKDGAEAMWNHLLAWKGEAIQAVIKTFIGTGGKTILTNEGSYNAQWPYYFKSGDIQSSKGEYAWQRMTVTQPAYKAGEQLLTRDPLDQLGDGRKNWQYLLGQRRVRKAPSLAYDTPSPVTSGFSHFDEGFMFNGALDRYDWKLLGKKEIFVPYNTNALHAAKTEQILLPDHLNPDYVRWELHRVWVVEGALAFGKRHNMPKRRFYLDEDTWNIVLAEGWDANGQLWHVNMALPLLAPDFPGVVVMSYAIYDLSKGGYVASSLFNDGGMQYAATAVKPEDEYSPDALTRQGVR